MKVRFLIDATNQKTRAILNVTIFLQSLAINTQWPSFSFDQEFGGVVGGFLRFVWQKEDAALTADVKYMKDDPSGWIFGLRLTAEF